MSGIYLIEYAKVDDGRCDYEVDSSFGYFTNKESAEKVAADLNKPLIARYERYFDNMAKQVSRLNAEIERKNKAKAIFRNAGRGAPAEVPLVSSMALPYTKWLDIIDSYKLASVVELRPSDKN